MTMLEQDDTLFSAEEGENVVDYAALSPLAIASIILGALSFLAIVHPLLLVIPVIAAGISVAAMYRIARAGGDSSGRGLALAALSLAVLFGAWSVSLWISYNAAIFGQARKHCDAWLDLVQRGDLQEVYELHLEFTQRQAPKTNLKGVYGPVTEQVFIPVDEFHSMSQEGLTLPLKFRAFWSQSPRREIALYRDQGRVTFLRYGTQRGFGAFAGVTVNELPIHYQFAYEADGKKESFEFVVMMHRHNFASRREWSVDRCDFPGQY